MMKTSRFDFQQQDGLGLPAAIFIIVIMALISVAINLLVQQNAQSFEEELNLTRAFYAAESGAGFAMNRIFPPEEYSSYTNGNCPNAAADTYDFNQDGLNQCSVDVTCELVTISGTTYATITSVGSCGDVERTIQVRTVY
jgi:MSHA biogenesis protein MshP